MRRRSLEDEDEDEAEEEDEDGLEVTHVDGSCQKSW